MNYIYKFSCLCNIKIKCHLKEVVNVMPKNFVKFYSIICVAINHFQYDIYTLVCTHIIM